MAHNQVEHFAQRKHFAPHWSTEAVNIALEKGDVFQAMFRVNAHNRVEAYCKIDGLPVDVLINGFHSQNRAIEGDIVAIKVEPLSSWTKMKGSIEPSRQAAMEDDNSLAGVSESNNENSFYGQTFGQHGPYEHEYISNGRKEVIPLVEKICSLINSFPTKRPTGRVVAIIENSPRRKTIVGFLRIKQWLFNKESFKKDTRKNKLLLSSSKREYIQLISTDPKFPKMMVPVKTLPDNIMQRLVDFDSTLEMDLVAAEIIEWGDEYDSPCAQIHCVFGKGGNVNSQISAILFQNSVDSSDFSQEAISCVPNLPWRIPEEEFRKRRDLRNLCTFTIDPANASDLDDALSLEKLPNNIYRIGVHIADVAYFVLPHTSLDFEAKTRSTSVYLLQRKLPMLPPLLSENLGSLSPGVERLALSIIWDFNLDGEILNRWIGKSIIKSCCKLSYAQADEILDDVLNVENNYTTLPQVYGVFTLSNVVNSVRNLYQISKVLKEKRFKEGALSLESPKIGFLFDENGIPYDTFLSKMTNSNDLVQEFMLLANTTAAEVITRAYPYSSLLRKHPEPKLSKLKDLEAFCGKHGLHLDTSNSGKFHESLECVREELKNDLVLFHVLISYATRPMQLATYFCSGDVADSGGDEWRHYALAVPLYTHFTSPLRRYPDIIVHRTLAATLEAEMILSLNLNGKKLFSGLEFISKEEVESFDVKKALCDAAMKYVVPSTELLADVAVHCNERKLASRYVKDAMDKLYMWLLLMNKEVFLSEARVLGLGPRFMSIYVTKLAIERRIYYDEVEGLMAEYLDATSTLVLNYVPHNRSHKKGSMNRFKSIEEAVMLTFPYNMDSLLDSDTSAIEPAVFPLVVRLLSTIPVAIHPIGGDDGPIDIGARLYMTSYLS